MEAKTKKWLLVGGTLLTVSGVAYYFYNKSKSEKSDSDDGGVVEPNDSTLTPPVTPIGSNVGSAPMLPTELQNSASVKKFQDFMDSIGSWVKGVDGKYKKLNKGTGYGIAGPSTLAAFNAYGDLYRVFIRSGAKGRIIPIASGSPTSVDIDLSNGHIARYQHDKKFVDFSKNYGSAENTGTWTNGGRKIVLTYGPKKGKTLDNSNLWDTLKALIS
jgi:hypothetical protein